MAIKAIITGSSGMVGKGVLLECLESDHVAAVLVINRSSIGLEHPKLTEILIQDFLEVETLKEQLGGYTACYFCMGVSAVGLSEEAYTQLSYEVPKRFADVLYSLNPDMTFLYVSGQGTDSTEQGRTMWARVKGKTENYVLAKGFKDAYAYRPGVILPEKGIKSRTRMYNFFYALFRPLFPLMRRSKAITTTTKLGQSMINLTLHPQAEKTVSNRRINELAE